MAHSTIIVKNTVFLYIRTLLIMLISIYTSRVLLDKLGVENFGVYNIVGGVVATFASLRGVFAQSVQRFLNFEKGQGNTEKVTDVFNISLLIHTILGIVFAVLVGGFGYYYIPRYLILPDGMLDTAMFVFYSSVVTSVIAIITIPYDSAIIANEKFDFYAIVSIFDVVARLAIIYILWIGEDILITYAILLAVVTIIFRFIHIIYCIRFPECKFKKVWNAVIFKELAGFSWWNFLGNTAFTLTNEGINFVINAFGGVTANAARGLAYQMKSAVTQLSGNIGIASRPFVSEAVVTQVKETIFVYVIMVSKAMFLMVSLTALPIIIYTQPILNFWLVKVPEYSVIFVQLVMLHIVIRSPQTGIDLLFSSYGKMRTYQIVQSVVLFLSLPLSYILLKIGFPIYWAFISMCIVELVTLIAIVVCASREMGLKLLYYLKNFVNRTLLITAVFCIVGWLFYRFLSTSNIWVVIMYSGILVCLGAILAYYLYLTKSEKALVKSFVNKKI